MQDISVLDDRLAVVSLGADSWYLTGVVSSRRILGGVSRSEGMKG
jgi:hypothetical protein